MDKSIGILALTVRMFQEDGKDSSSSMEEIQNDLNALRSRSKGSYGHLTGGIASRALVKYYRHDEESAKSLDPGVWKAGEAATFYAVTAHKLAKCMEEDVGLYFPSAQESTPKVTNLSFIRAEGSATVRDETIADSETVQ
jgi:hypothetical protein